MKAQTLMARAYNMFTTNQNNTTKKEKTMKRVIAALALVAMGMGLSTPASAASGYHLVTPERINFIEHEPGYTGLYLTGNHSCGGKTAYIFTSDDNHDRMANLLNLAQATRTTMTIWVNCGGNANGSDQLISILMQ